SSTARSAENPTAGASPFGRNSGSPATPGTPRPAVHETAPPAPAAADVKKQWEAQSNQSISRTASNEELCGISSAMTTDQIRELLAMLYRRHNRAASSLDEKLRDEAEHMLEAIAAMKEKYLGKI
ncbi:MAG: hypothetical protein KA004_13930, partial [Verrucomicrobiales bacterium]|nr:hypothetical protein [Verrucomicrobiales bacterium]